MWVWGIWAQVLTLMWQPFPHPAPSHPILILQFLCSSDDILFHASDIVNYKTNTVEGLLPPAVHQLKHAIRRIKSLGCLTSPLSPIVRYTQNMSPAPVSTWTENAFISYVDVSSSFLTLLLCPPLPTVWLWCSNRWTCWIFSACLLHTKSQA